MKRKLDNIKPLSGNSVFSAIEQLPGEPSTTPSQRAQERKEHSEGVNNRLEKVRRERRAERAGEMIPAFNEPVIRKEGAIVTNGTGQSRPNNPARELR